MRKDLKQFRIEESSWYHEAQDRDQWRAVCKEGLTTCTERQKERMNSCGPLTAASASIPAAPLLVCPIYSRSFRGNKILQDTRVKQPTHEVLS